MDSAMELTIQNTCTNCPIPNGAYYPILVTNRQTGDTLNVLCYCYNPPLNGKTRKYLFRTKPGQLPGLKTLKFGFGNLCKDLTYLPN